MTAEETAQKTMEKTFDAATAEARISAAWEAAGSFRAGANAKPGAPSFCVMIPPPNVTGSLHMGHAFNNTLQDILVRWHRMRGHDTLWQPGTDHAGIATQMVTEREMAARGEPSRRDMGREAFTTRVWEQKQKSRGTIIGQLKRLGASCDWSREAFTMSGAPGAPAGEEGNFHDAVIKVFVAMYNHKDSHGNPDPLIYRGKRLVNWDPQFETAISDLEVENIETDGHMWHFKYPLAGGATYEYVEKDAEGNVTLRETRDYISIATTRPETMLGDGAVAVHPSDARYAPIVGMLCEIPVGPKAHRRLIPIITDDYPDPNFGSGAVKITGAHDFNDYGVAKRNGIPCYRLMDTRGAMRSDGASYDEVAQIAGAVARGEQTLSEAAVDALNLVPDHLRGLDRFEARKAVVAEITSEGLAVMTRADDPRLGKVGSKPTLQGDADADAAVLVPLVEAKKIMQPFGDRSKVVIEPMLTDQWFVDTAKIVGPALDAVKSGRVKIIPESGERTYYHWLENIEPWCISRQLWWGHQIPVWYGPSEKSVTGTGSASGMVVCAADYETAVSQVRAHYAEMVPECDLDFFEADAIEAGSIGDQRAKIEFIQRLEILGSEGVHPVDELQQSKSGALRFRRNRETERREVSIGLSRDPDVLDTWFSSGLWPIGTLGWPEDTPEMRRYFPTSVLVTGQDILFFWVARMMMMQLAVVGQVPFDTVYLHGLVRDAKGQKMSKSLGNVIDPLEIIAEYGADALRFSSAAMAALGGVLKLDKSRIAGYRNFGTKLWNACRFAEMNGVWDGHATQVQLPAATATLNRWILGETARTRAAVDAALADYRFNDAADALYKFVWGKVCDWYVEFSKPLLMDGTDAEKAETRAVMAYVLDRCMMLLHPFMPFITEDIWAQTGTRAEMLVTTDWPDLGADIADTDADREMGWVIALIEDIRSVRAQMHVPAGLHVPLAVTGFGPEARTAWARNEVLIRRLARIESLTEVDAFPKGTVTIPADGATFGLPLAGVIDVGGEKARLEKTLDKLLKELAGMEARLNNAAFVASAPEEVVTETRAQVAQKQDEARVLRGALARLAELG